MVAIKNSIIAELTTTALAQEKLAGFSKVLSVVAKALDAQGCILWRQTLVEKTRNNTERQFFVLSSWLPEQTPCYVYNLSSDSPTGLAAERKTTKIVNNTEIAQSQDETSRFLSEFGAYTYCTAPVRFSKFNEYGALNIYRQIEKPFRSMDKDTLRQFAKVIPFLYQALQNKVANELLQNINKTLGLNKFDALTKEAMKGTGVNLCRIVADTFHALEVSLYMRDNLDDLGERGPYSLMATTWPKTAINPMLPSYDAIRTDGLTGWVLHQRLSLRLFDLNHFEEDEKQVKIKYPRLTWKSKDLNDDIGRLLASSENGNLLPRSFMAAPIHTYGKTLGVIRCNVAKAASCYFSMDDVVLLRKVGDLIGQTWYQWLIQQRNEEENNAWRELVQNMTGLNQFIVEQIDEEDFTETKVFDQVLRIAHEVVPHANISDIRLIDKVHAELKFARTIGEAWTDVHKGITHPLDGKSSGAAVISNKTSIILTNIKEEDPNLDTLTFSDTFSMIISPIMMADQAIGVIDIRTTEPFFFPKYTQYITTLLGRQLGLYLSLFETMDQLRKERQQQKQAYEDLAHQLISPILQIQRRATDCIDTYELDNNAGRKQLLWQLQALRGLTSKALRTCHSLSLFVVLAREKKLQLNLYRLTPEQCSKILFERIMDQKSVTDPSKLLGFQLEKKNFEVLHSHHVSVDIELLTQALSNVLDNAAKYSYKNTKIRLSCGLTNNHRFHITIASQGIALTDAGSCKQRGWRSIEAKLVTGEGSGIGLWIVDHIMKAHKGELLMILPKKGSITEVKLIFPIRQGK